MEMEIQKEQQKWIGRCPTLTQYMKAFPAWYTGGPPVLVLRIRTQILIDSQKLVVLEAEDQPVDSTSIFLFSLLFWVADEQKLLPYDK